MDRIGKAGRVRTVAIAPSGDATRRNGDFGARLAAPHASAKPEKLSPQSPLAKLRAGEITTGQYIEHKVAEATGHLEGLSPARVAFIQRQLHEAVATEPELRALVAALSQRA